MENIKNISAQELMLIYQKNSPTEAYKAFEELYSRYSNKVYRYLIRKCRNEADTEDLMQKVFFKVHDSKHLYKDQYSFEQWLFVIARTSLLDHLRTKSRIEKKLNSYSGHLTNNDIKKELDIGFLDTLPKHENEILVMKFIDELGYEEMSKILNKSEVSLRKSVSRVINKIRKGEVYE